MSDDSAKVGVGIGQSKFSDLDGLSLVEIKVLYKFNLILFFYHFWFRLSIQRIVPIAFQLGFFYDVA